MTTPAYSALPVADTALDIPQRPPSIRTSLAHVHRADGTGFDGDTVPVAFTERFVEEGSRQHGVAAFIGRSCFVVLLTAAVLVGTAAFVFATRFVPQRPDSTELAFFVIGDWGKTGSRHQQDVADFMGAIGSHLSPDLIISTGDNLYPSGMNSPADPAFKATFSDIYTAPSLQVPWHAVLGNHDYGQGSQKLPGASECPLPDNLAGCPPGCCYSPAWQSAAFNQSVDARWHCQQGARQLLLLNGTFQLVLLDTSPFIPMYHKEPWASVPGGITSQHKKAQKVAVAAMLSQPGPTWRMVVGHHSIRSYGKKCVIQKDCLQFTWLARLMQAAGVQMYLNGHDHLLQHVKLPNETTHYLTSGGGAEFHRQDFDQWAPTRPFAQFLEYEHGFAAVFVGQRRAVVRLYGLTGGMRPLHEFTIPLAS